MKKYDYIVIGAGIVGLATALELLERNPNSKVAVIDKANTVASEQTGHNSNVVHAGIYYEPGSLKARLCREGNKWTYSFCKSHHIPFIRCGKMVVAADSDEQLRLNKLYERALDNQLNVTLLDHRQLKEAEPNINGVAAIHLKTTAITDYRQIAEKMAKDIHNLGGQIFLGQNVVNIVETNHHVVISTFYEDLYSIFECDHLIVCGGIQADTLMKLSGIEPDFKMIPFKGEYYQLPVMFKQISKRLIYPVPNPELPFLGIHLTRMIDGTQTVGPNAVMSFSKDNYNKIAFNVKDTYNILSFPGFWKMAKKFFVQGVKEQWDSLDKNSYIKRVNKYCNCIDAKDLRQYSCGIRAQAIRNNGETIDDFEIKATDRILHVINAPSPAATSAHPIANYLVNELEGIENN